ncbi:MAG: hypothetical protein JWP36_2306 [Paucimonas sp.]|nr:hypothetical protein [Paucimonas sp.]
MTVIQTHANPLFIPPDPTAGATAGAGGNAPHAPTIAGWGKFNNLGHYHAADQAPDIPPPARDVETTIIIANSVAAEQDNAAAQGLNAYGKGVLAVKKKTMKESAEAAEAARKRTEERNSLTPAEKALKWLEKIFSVVAAVVAAVIAIAACVGSGGAAIPLAVVAFMAVAGAVQAVLGFVQEAMTECGVKNGDKPYNLDVLSNVVEAMTDVLQKTNPEFAEKCKNDPSYRDKWVMGWTIALNVTVAVATVALSIGAAARAAGKIAESAASATSMAAKAVSMTARVVEGIAQFIASMATVSSAGIAFHTARLELDTENDLAYQTMKDQVVAWLSEVFETQSHAMSKFVSAYLNKMTSISAMIEETNRQAEAAAMAIAAPAA